MSTHFKIAYDSNGTEYMVRIPFCPYVTNHMKFVYTDDGEEIFYTVPTSDTTASVHIRFPEGI